MFVSPLQGSGPNVIHTQGDGNPRKARLALPWADIFWPLQGEIRRTRKLKLQQVLAVLVEAKVALSN